MNVTGRNLKCKERAKLVEVTCREKNNRAQLKKYHPGINLVQSPEVKCQCGG